jgi:sugar transferase (PEP-CTERM/EpsH1 system associated)
VSTRAPSAGEGPPLIAHVLQHLIIGGLENGLVNLINHTPPGRFRHAIICLSHFSDFRTRLRSPEIPLIALGKRPGKDPRTYRRLWQLLRRMRPAVVHARNLSALDSVVVAWAAGVPHRIYGQHGWDVQDLHGRSGKYRLLRRVCHPFIERYVAVSAHTAHWLEETIGVRANQIEHIANGVDTAAFRPLDSGRRTIPEAPFKASDVVIGTVGRMQPVKDQATLIRAFIALRAERPDIAECAKLMLIGDGPLRGELLGLLLQAGAGEHVWAPGSRGDVAHMLQGMDVFVLPSLNEGMSNAILEAMASGLPIVATDVGGNAELVEPERTGVLTAPGDVGALAQALKTYLEDPERRRNHGQAARRRALREFSLDVMVSRYLALYDGIVGLQRTAGSYS